MDWRIGCSGFYYREWKEFFYPKGLAQKDWFKYYCEHFNTIEINSTFYKIPTQKSFDKWYNESPDNFLFTIKAPRLITHYKQFNECELLLSDFYDIMKQGLNEKLGCVLFQFPPKFKHSKERLEILIQNLNLTFHNVLEFRDTSWWQEDVFKTLAENNITFCGQSYPSLIPQDIIHNTDILYYRFHGKPILYKSEYPRDVIQDFYNQIPKNSQQAFIYFNNTWGLGALNNARQLLEMINTNT